MLTTIHTVAIKDGIPPGELPATPDDIDLDRIVNDPDYRRAVQTLLRRWGICGNRGKTRRLPRTKRRRIRR